MKKIQEVDFRQLYHKLLYIRCPELIEKLAKNENLPVKKFTINS